MESTSLSAESHGGSGRTGQLGNSEGRATASSDVNGGLGSGATQAVWELPRSGFVQRSGSATRTIGIPLGAVAEAHVMLHHGVRLGSATRGFLSREGIESPMIISAGTLDVLCEDMWDAIA